MATQTSFTSSATFFIPVLHLYPLFFERRRIHNTCQFHKQPTLEDRSTDECEDGSCRWYFDSKVLSRLHAEVWEEGGKIFIKDVKSSNGTFANGERLNPEGLANKSYEFKSDDIVEFWINILGKDSKTIIQVTA